MINRAMLAQARRGIRRLIDESPTWITIFREAMIDNGFGGLTPDPFGTPSEHTYKVRISHERKAIDEYNPTAAGFSTSLQRYITADHKTEIQEGDIFEAIDGKQWRIGPVDPLIKHGGLIGKQAVLLIAAQASP